MHVQRVDIANPSADSLEIFENAWDIRSQGSLFTREAESCAVIAVYNAKAGAGYLGHFTTIGIKDNKIFRKFHETVRTNEARSHLSIWMGGITLISDLSLNQETVSIYNAEALRDRKYLEEIFKTIGRETTLRTDWGTTNQAISAAQLNCKQGTLDFSTRMS